MTQTSQLSRFHRVSHAFNTFLTVSQWVLHFSRFYKFQVDFLSNSQFSKKTIKATQSPVKKISQHCPLQTNKINIFVIFDSETSTRSCLEMVVQSFTKKSLKNIPQALILLKVYFFFFNLEFFQRGYQKRLCWSASLKEAQYLNKTFFNIEFNNLLMFFLL